MIIESVIIVVSAVLTGVLIGTVIASVVNIRRLKAKVQFLDERVKFLAHRM